MSTTMTIEFKSVGEILAYLTEETLLMAERHGNKKSTPKNRLKRLLNIADIGLRGLEIFKAIEDAKGYERTYNLLKAREGQTAPNGVKTFYTLEGTAAYVLECSFATHEYIRSLRRASSADLQQTNKMTDAGIAGFRKFNLGEAAKKGKCGRVVDAMGIAALPEGFKGK